MILYGKPKWSCTKVYLTPQKDVIIQCKVQVYKYDHKLKSLKYHTVLWYSQILTEKEVYYCKLDPELFRHIINSIKHEVGKLII